MEGANLGLPGSYGNNQISFIHFTCGGAELKRGNYGFGVAYSISDTSGNLLFYVNNGEIYDTNGTVILKFDSYNYYLGEYVLIVPYPQGYDEYYIVYNKWNNGNINDQSQNYCIFNIKTKTITSKGSFAANEYFCAAAKYRNKENYWLTFMDGTDFYAYLVDSSGLHTNAIVSPYPYLQFTTPYNLGVNVFRFSPDAGRLYAMALFSIDTGGVEAIDFDNSTGQFSNAINLISVPAGSYHPPPHVALSPDSKKLYFPSEDNVLYQYDLSSDNINIINKSKTLISNDISDLFEGSDMKLYGLGDISSIQLGIVGSINNPDNAGISCDYEASNSFANFFLDDLDYSPFLTRQGFWPSFSIDTDAYNAFIIHLSYNDPRNGQSYKWNFGNKLSGVLNHDTGAITQHTYPFGADTIRLVVKDQYGYKEVFKRAICINSPFVHRVHDTVICAGSSITLNSGNPTSSHLWSTGDTTQLVTLRNSGKYWVRFQYHNLQETDSFSIKYDYPQRTYNFLPHDTTICKGYPLHINLDSIHGTITWQDSVISKTFTIFQTGTYHAILQNACGNYKDSIHVTAIPCNTGNINVFPNPFDNIVQIQIELSKASNVQIKVYDAISRYITTIADAQQSTEIENYTFNAEKYSLAPGVYFIKIVIDDKVYVRPVVKE